MEPSSNMVEDTSTVRKEHTQACTSRTQGTASEGKELYCCDAVRQITRYSLPSWEPFIRTVDDRANWQWLIAGVMGTLHPQPTTQWEQVTNFVQGARNFHRIDIPHAQFGVLLANGHIHGDTDTTMHSIQQSLVSTCKLHNCKGICDALWTLIESSRLTISPKKSSRCAKVI